MPKLPVHVSKLKVKIVYIYTSILEISGYISDRSKNNDKILLFLDSVGAVALPDGRVLICGGEMLDRKDGGVSNENFKNILN